KDQAYMLYKLTQEQLRYTLLPLGELTKKEVRVIAEREGLPVAQKRDSQELCFAAAGDHADYIERHCRESLPEKGNFVDESGRVLGVHKGIYRYTVGQRRGLGLTLGHPAYVKRICAESREIVIGDEHSLYSGGVVCIDVIFMSMPEPEPGTLLRCMVKIRYSHAPQAAVLEMTADGAARITFDSPVRAAAPGQAAVFYDGAGCVIGGGVILESFARP
ncbi:MAG: tRNA 2-thiouridine(34) synthase MnmA, partial [Oscillospiraceae bacterium]|nr:tRNA 2-thiouridine(34) synthase MnmA [Oscillospiraceae bacterium]